MQNDYTVTVSIFELFSLEMSLTISRPPTSTSVPLDLAAHGFLAKTPVSPEVAVGFQTLELFHRLRLRKPSISVEAFTKVICDYYEVGLFVSSLRNPLLTHRPCHISSLSVGIIEQSWHKHTRSIFVYCGSSTNELPHA